MGLFRLGRRRDDAGAAAARHVADEVRRILALGEDDAVTVSEIACGDPECGGAETVILLMRAGQRTRAAKVRKSLALIDSGEIEEAARTLL